MRDSIACLQSALNVFIRIQSNDALCAPSLYELRSFHPFLSTAKQLAFNPVCVQPLKRAGKCVNRRLVRLQCLHFFHTIYLGILLDSRDKES